MSGDQLANTANFMFLSHRSNFAPNICKCRFGFVSTVKLGTMSIIVWECLPNPQGGDKWHRCNWDPFNKDVFNREYCNRYIYMGNVENEFCPHTRLGSEVNFNCSTWFRTCLACFWRVSGARIPYFDNQTHPVHTQCTHSRQM